MTGWIKMPFAQWVQVFFYSFFQFLQLFTVFYT